MIEKGLYSKGRTVINIITVGKEISYGYDLRTEKFEKHLNDDLSRIPEDFIRLLGDKKIKYRIAKQIAKSQHEIGSILGVSARTVHGYASEYN